MKEEGDDANVDKDTVEAEETGTRNHLIETGICYEGMQHSCHAGFGSLPRRREMACLSCV